MASKAFNYEASSPSVDGAGGGSSRQAQGARACSGFVCRQDLPRWQVQGFGGFDEDEVEDEGMEEQPTSHRGLLSNSNGSGARVAHAISQEGVDRNEKEEGKQMQEDDEEDDGWGSDEAEAFMQRLKQQGGLVSVPGRTQDSAGERPRDPKR